MKLCTGNTCVSKFTCTFHSMQGNLDGIWHIPRRCDFPEIEDRKFNPPEAKTGVWDGFVFINPDPDAAPLDDYLGVLKTHFAANPLEERYTAAFIRKPITWSKRPGTPSRSAVTPRRCMTAGDEGNVHIDRLTTPMAIPSEWFDGVVTPDIGLKQSLSGSQLLTDLPEGRRHCRSRALHRDRHFAAPQNHPSFHACTPFHIGS